MRFHCLGNRLIRRIICTLMTALLSGVVMSSSVSGQLHQAHRFYHGFLPPGTIGQTKVQFEPGLAGYVQPVQLVGPEQCVIGVADGTSFQSFAQQATVGLQIGNVYRLKVEQVPTLAGAEVYPTIELLDRLYPPEGNEWRFPVVVQITKEDVELAMSGRLVTRVIYLEDPKNANPDYLEGEQYTLSVTSDEDPLHVAYEYGRPMAILRLGSIAPGPLGVDDHFVFGSPPIQFYQGGSVAPAPRFEEPIQVPREPSVMPLNVPNSINKQETLPDVEDIPEPDANPFLDDAS
ncbi:MAG: hypothetical protein KDA87_12245 [Planctomycetales bacterium]|nr:hypothetical protein [Planctomycetales bacterium]